MPSEMKQQIEALAQGPPKKTAPPPGAFLKASEVWRQNFLPEENFAGFQGHFEGRPVLPALAQVLMAQATLEAALGRPLRLAAITQAKFLSPLPPGRGLSVYAQGPGPTGEWRFHLTSDGDNETTDVAFLRIQFQDDHV